MAVDPAKPKRVLVVHGVEAGTDADLHQDRLIDSLIRSRLGGMPLSFGTELYRYENINDRAQRRLRQLIQLFLTNIIARTVVDLTADIVLDVLIALKDGSTARTIRQGLVDRILEIYRDGHPCYLVAHSLGTIYAFDAVNQLIGTEGLFDRNDRGSWPLFGLVTLGSPIGLRMFNRSRVRSLGHGRAFPHTFPWLNYWDRTDPVVSGSFYGKPRAGYRIVERFGSKSSGWGITDRVIDTGKVWVDAHCSYWTHPGLGDDLVSLLA
ncbi:MAG TPA: hypothetical protein VEI24_05945 [Nitrospiria bacterium]|nr:hypothetical protein [Nitrospiria bacterium]